MAAPIDERAPIRAPAAEHTVNATLEDVDPVCGAPDDFERAAVSVDRKTRMYAEAAERPRLRGVLHAYTFFAAVGGVGILLARASTTRAVAGAVVYALALLSLFGTSALLHRRRWTPRACAWMRRLDHAMIYVLIAGTYTPIALLVLSPGWSMAMLIAAWTGAVLGIGFQFFWRSAPGWLAQVLYMVNGWLVVLCIPQLAMNLGVGWVVLIMVGGLFYTLGSINLARRRPNPAPAVFGYHEVFHTLVVLAAVVHFVVINVAVLPRG